MGIGQNILKSLNRDGRRLCEHTSVMGMSFLGGTCDACKTKAEIERLADEQKNGGFINLPKNQTQLNSLLQKRLNRNGRRLCKHTSVMGMSFLGGDCKACKHSAAFLSAMAKRNARNAGVELPKTQDEQNPELQKRLNRNGRRLCKHTAWWNPSDCKACKHSAAFLSAMAKRNARNAGVELPKTQDEQNPELQKRLN